jgi:hypothetical protein
MLAVLNGLFCSAVALLNLRVPPPVALMRVGPVKMPEPPRVQVPAPCFSKPPAENCGRPKSIWPAPVPASISRPVPVVGLDVKALVNLSTPLALLAVIC